MTFGDLFLVPAAVVKFAVDRHVLLDWNLMASQDRHKNIFPCVNFTELLLHFFGQGPSGKPSHRGISMVTDEQICVTGNTVRVLRPVVNSVDANEP